MKDDKKIDESLLGNEKIEEAIKLLQGECTQEMLAHTLTVIRKQMRKGGQFIIAVEPYISSEKINIGVVQSPDGLKWWSAFTSFDEELKGGNEVKSTFLTDIEQLFKSALEVGEISGIILNPWNRTIMLDKKLISIILEMKTAKFTAYVWMQIENLALIIVVIKIIHTFLPVVIKVISALLIESF